MTYKEKSRIKNKGAWLAASIINTGIAVLGMLLLLIGISAADTSENTSPVVLALVGSALLAFVINNCRWMEGGEDDEET